MTPKEKAKELVDKYEEYAYTMFDRTKGFAMDMLLKNQKMCALICVDEIIKMEDEAGVASYTKSAEKYWLQVKAEIEKL